ncbi:MAG: exosortase/archaeosortase family protein, partial [Armatimonadetes bacterium]|nr:exosortase/archaeosortase family protein [Armatimonadota bacterium]
MPPTGDGATRKITLPRPADGFTVGIGAGAVLLLVWLATDTLSFWWWEWTRPNGFYSHGVLVPPLAGLVLWHRRELAAPKPGDLVFLLSLGFCLFAHLLAVRAEMQAAQSISFLGIVAGAAAFAGGWNWFRRVALPALALLALAMPLPAPLLHDATARLQTLSASGAQALLNVTGFAPVTRNGNVLIMPQYTMDVDTPCSGLQTLLTAIALSVALALLSDLPRARSLVLISLAVP